MITNNILIVLCALGAQILVIYWLTKLSKPKPKLTTKEQLLIDIWLLGYNDEINRINPKQNSTLIKNAYKLGRIDGMISIGPPTKHNTDPKNIIEEITIL